MVADRARGNPWVVAQSKKRGLALIGTMLVLALLVGSIPGARLAWAAVVPLLVALLIQLAAPIDDDPDIANRPAKLPFFGVCTLAGLAATVWGLVIIRQGRNPWWMRAPADYWRR